MTEVEPACIQYHGEPGATKPCVDAVVRLVQSRVGIKAARILSCRNEVTTDHALLLTDEVEDQYFVKAGFASGYGGEGPRGLSFVLALLEQHGADIDECEIAEDVLERSHLSGLTADDLRRIREAEGRYPRMSKYIDETDFERQHDGTLWRNVLPIMPLALIDPRIADLAMVFWARPSDTLRTGYARLEDIVRARANLTSYGDDLFTQAFLRDGAPLTWKCHEPAEIKGRANLFKGAVLAHRNPLAHRELQISPEDALSEFLLLNHLYKLEAQAIPMSGDTSDGSSA